MRQARHGPCLAGNIELARPVAGIPWYERIPSGLALRLGGRMRSLDAVGADRLIGGRRILAGLRGSR